MVERKMVRNRNHRITHEQSIHIHHHKAITFPVEARDTMNEKAFTTNFTVSERVSMFLFTVLLTPPPTNNKGIEEDKKKTGIY